MKNEHDEDLSRIRTGEGALGGEQHAESATSGARDALLQRLREGMENDGWTFLAFLSGSAVSREIRRALDEYGGNCSDPIVLVLNGEGER